MGPRGELKYWLSGPKMEQEGGGGPFFFLTSRDMLQQDLWWELRCVC